MEINEKMLNTLESIDGTLKRIEQLISVEKQHEVIKEAVSHAMFGEKYNSTPKEDRAVLSSNANAFKARRDIEKART